MIKRLRALLGDQTFLEAYERTGMADSLSQLHILAGGERPEECRPSDRPLFSNLVGRKVLTLGLSGLCQTDSLLDQTALSLCSPPPPQDAS